MNAGAVALVFLALSAGFSSAAAQDRLLVPGARIRFGVGPSDTHTADLEQATPDSLFLRNCPSCERLRYSRSDVNRLAVFRRIPATSRVLTGFGFGGLAGLALGLLGSTTCHGIGDECDGGIVLVPLGGLLGGLIGGLAGYLTAYRWLPIAPTH